MVLGSDRNWEILQSRKQGVLEIACETAVILLENLCLREKTHREAGHLKIFKFGKSQRSPPRFWAKQSELEILLSSKSQRNWSGEKVWGYFSNTLKETRLLYKKRDMINLSSSQFKKKKVSSDYWNTPFFKFPWQFLLFCNHIFKGFPLLLFLYERCNQKKWREIDNTRGNN